MMKGTLDLVKAEILDPEVASSSLEL